MKSPSFPFIRLFMLAIFVSSCAQEPLERPNILWLTSEDNNIDWVGCYGNEFAETPNLDALAAEGFRYTHCYANTPVCGPQRSTWISGMYALSMGTHPMRSRYEIPHDSIGYYPDYLRQAGYFVSNGHKTDYNIGGRNDRDCWDAMDENKSGKPVVDWEVLEQNQPFFKIVNFNTSHESRAFGDIENTDHDPASTDLRDYHPDIPAMRKNYAKYHDAVKTMDAQVGEVLSKLSELGLAENTIVIYNSDHGGVLPRSKRFLYASGIHTPLIVRVPEKYSELYPAGSPGETVDRIVSFVDMPATWLSLAGATIPEHMQGTVFLGKDLAKEKQYHFAFRARMDERVENARAVYDKDYVYIRNYMTYVPWLQHLNYLWNMQATQAWVDHAKTGKGNLKTSKYFYPKTYTEELYSLKDDWDNTNNLIDDPEQQARIVAMRKALHEWQIEIHDAGLLPESEMARSASENGTTIFELVRDENQYNVPALLDAADLALEQDSRNLDRLRGMLKHEDRGIRYWGMTGCFLLGDAAGALEAIEDVSHEVRALAAWTLIRSGNRSKGFHVLEEMLNSYSYATLTILNIIDWMGEDGERFIPLIDAMDLSGSGYNYERRMQDYLRIKTFRIQASS